MRRKKLGADEGETEGQLCMAGKRTSASFFCIRSKSRYLRGRARHGACLTGKKSLMQEYFLLT